MSTLRPLILSLVFAALLAGPAVHESAMGQEAAGAADTPEAVVRRVAGDLLESLEQNQEAYRADPSQLEKLVRRDLLPALDVEYSARLILGRAGRGATTEQISAFAQTMSDVLIDRYATGMLEYEGRERMEILPQRGELNERATRVRTRVRTTNGAQVPVDYVFRKTDDGWKAFDVIVEGISYVTTYRNQIMPQVDESGIDAVTERLARGELKLGE
ncbi:MAG: ABC transporter substrate-binding protein [Xanthomonadales bacterium]|jgi:phospholipid transport system substrate-binding protein|nr:ABC transporter substrate-binding protein [Xanthomonadales bacterium]